MLDNLKDLGFKFSCKSGVTISINDIKVVPEKAEILAEADKAVDKTNLMYQRGLLDEKGRHEAVVRKWEETQKKLSKCVEEQFRQDKYNPLYDPRQANNVCINGQLLLLDLIEKLEHKCKLVQSNTDGILIKITQDNIYEVKSICEAWSKRTKMVLEYEEFVKVIQRDVNNYIIVAADGSYKSKGLVVKKLSTLDNDLPIVNRAVTDYFVRGIRPEDTIFSTEDMLQFQQVFKVSGKYMYAMHGEEKLNGRCFRVFASRSLSDGGIFKKKNEDKNKEKFANSPERVFIENGDITNMKVPRKLDRQWYVDLAYKRIKQFVGEK